MVRELPRFKGYSVDERLGEFRKVTLEPDGYRMETVTFESAEGQRLIMEMVAAQARERTTRRRA